MLISNSNSIFVVWNHQHREESYTIKKEDKFFSAAKPKFSRVPLQPVIVQSKAEPQYFINIWNDIKTIINVNYSLSKQMDYIRPQKIKIT